MADERDAVNPGDGANNERVIVGIPHMANVVPPNELDFNNPAAWPAWKKRFTRYMSLSSFGDKEDSDKIDMLIYVMGEKSEDIFVQFKPLPTTYDATLQAFEDYFIPRRNVMFERFKFNSRMQAEGESVDFFITDVHALAEQCNFGTFKDELIRDCILVGMLDAKLSERLQLKETLTLQETITAAKQSEIQHKQN